MVVEILYPHNCNLFGDRGNVIYLQKNLPEATFVETGLNDKPYFADNVVDLIYLGPSSESAQELFVNRLTPYKCRLNELIENGTVFLLTGNAVEVFGKEVTDKDGTGFKGLGLLDLTAERNMLNRMHNLYMGKFLDFDVVGFQSQFTITYTNEKGLFENVFGMGWHNGSKFEGVRKNNLFATYLVGPLLVLNPLFTKELFKTLKIENKTLYLEDEVMEAYKLRVEDFLRAQKINNLK